MSTATVSRALNGTGQVAEGKRAAIASAVEQLGYRPNTIARSLVTRSTQTIALLLPDITNPFYAELVAGIHELTLERGHTMLLCTTDFDPEQEERYLRLLRGKHVDGALVDGLVLPPERIAGFVEDGFPIVCLDRDVDSPAVPLVQVDNRMGARLATDHLLSLGHRCIAHIAGATARISEERLLGYQGALAGAGIAPDSSLVAMGNLHRGRRPRRDAGAARRRARPHGGLRRQRPVGDRSHERDRRRRSAGCPATLRRGLRRRAPVAVHGAAADDRAAARAGDRALRHGAAAGHDRRSPPARRCIVPSRPSLILRESTASPL